MTNRYPCSDFIKYLHITSKEPSEILRNIFDIEVSAEVTKEITKNIVLPKDAELLKKRTKKLLFRFGCEYIFDEKKRLFKISKNKRKLKFVNTAIKRGVSSHYISQLLNSSILEIEEFMIFEEKDVDIYKRAIMNFSEMKSEEIESFCSENSEMFYDDEKDFVELIFESGMKTDPDLEGMASELAVITFSKAIKNAKKDSPEEIKKSNTLLNMASKAIDIKNKLAEIRKSNEPSTDNLEQFMIEFDRAGVTRPKLRREVED